MKATLSIEFIGASSYAHLKGLCDYFDLVGGNGFGDRFIGRPKGKPWVAEITGKDDHYGLARDFLQANWDYSDAHAKGNRGVYLWFILESNKLYEVYRKVSWKNSERYFCAVSEDGRIYRLDDEEVSEWLNALSE